MFVIPLFALQTYLGNINFLTYSQGFCQDFAKVSIFDKIKNMEFLRRVSIFIRLYFAGLSKNIISILLLTHFLKSFEFYSVPYITNLDQKSRCILR